MKNLNTAVYIRSVDELGRVALPKELRVKTHLSSKDIVNISLCDEKIIIKKNIPVA